MNYTITSVCCNVSNYNKIFAAVVLLFAFSANVNAELLKTGGLDFGLFYALDVKVQQNDGSYENHFTYVNGILVETGGLETVRMFCSDIGTPTSEAFSKGGGQEYNTVSLENSDFHTDVQKAMLQSLFDHVYNRAFNDDYSQNDILFGSIFQLAVWEITAETSGVYNVDKNSPDRGSFYVDGGFGNAGDLTHGAVANWGQKFDMTDVWATLNGWLAASQDATGALWRELGYDYSRVELTVHIAEGGSNVSQTFIQANTATPEPASMLIFASGALAAGVFAARRKQQNLSLSTRE